MKNTSQKKFVSFELKKLKRDEKKVPNNLKIQINMNKPKNNYLSNLNSGIYKKN